MKRNCRNVPLDEFVDPVPFDYTLLSHLYVHKDGNDVIDFAGDNHGEQVDETEVDMLLHNRSMFSEMPRSTARDPLGTYVCMQVHDETAPPRRRVTSRLVRTVDTVGHLWLISQPSDERPPYARTFHSPRSLFDYTQEHNMALPRCRGRDAVRAIMPPPGTDTATNAEPQPGSFLPLPRAKWIDLQCVAGDPTSAQIVRDVLAHFPLDPATVDRCLCIDPRDHIDTDHLSGDDASYIFLTLACTPVLPPAYKTPNEPFNNVLRRQQSHPFAQGENTSAKSVMQMRFDAMLEDKPRRDVPSAVGVAVILFADWVITVHNTPFVEMDDLFRVLKFHCSPPQDATGAEDGKSAANCALTSPTPTRFTTPFFFASLMQIAVGHHIDNVTLAHAVDELGDTVFDVKARLQEQMKVVRHITAVGRCFGECSADVNRRESIVASLLQPHMAHYFLLRDPSTRHLLENALAHLRYVQHELEDSRDTVALSNWYHNVAVHWTLVRSGNSAVRIVLLFSEMANILYPILIVQTLYSMNLTLPYMLGSDPPHLTLLPFFLLAVFFAVYALFCTPAALRMLHRRTFKTTLLV